MKAGLIKKILIALGAALLILQFFRGTPPEVTYDNPADLFANEVVSADVATLLRNACYDCHSMETQYPWYSYVTPVSWWLFDHVRHGRDELNFSEWMAMSVKRQVHKLKEVSEEVEKGKMPLESYTPVHPEANLSDEQRQQISDWALELAAVVSARQGGEEQE